VQSLERDFYLHNVHPGMDIYRPGESPQLYATVCNGSAAVIQDCCAFG